MKDAELLALHRELVSIHSLSHKETPIADYVENVLLGFGAEVWRVGDNVLARAGSGPRLLLNSHLDTVPATDKWIRDPLDPVVENGCVYGLGANDAKASVAAMIAAFHSVVEHGGPCETVLMLVPEEESGGKGTEVALPWLRMEKGWSPQGAVIGEPTDLQIGIAQKGLMILELTAEGDPCHAGNALRLGAVNPVWQLARDLISLQNADLGPEHPLLGKASLQPTALVGAAVHNQVPAKAIAVLDLRTVPGITHHELLANLRPLVSGELRERSTRLIPYQCNPEAPIVRAASRSGSRSELFASPTMSDQVFFSGLDAIKCGPGQSARSHTPDEYVLESEILEGAKFYRSMMRAFAEELV